MNINFIKIGVILNKKVLKLSGLFCYDFFLSDDFALPFSFNAFSSKNSICPFKLRNSSSAHFSSSFSVSGLIRNTNAFFSDTLN